MSDVAAPTVTAAVSVSGPLTPVIPVLTQQTSLAAPAGWRFRGSASLGDSVDGRTPPGWVVDVYDLATHEFIKSATVGGDGFWSIDGIQAGLTCAAIAYSPTNEHPPRAHVNVVTA